jgi:hypothetical protein
MRENLSIMKKLHTHFYEKGFISVATMILMIASLGVIMTMMYRSTQGSLLVGKLRQSNQAYQSGDGLAEGVLQDFQNVDNGIYSVPGIDSSKKIPENIFASVFCNAESATCYTNTGNKIDPTDMTLKMSDVTRISLIQSTASVTRALQASVQERIPIPSTVVTVSMLFSLDHKISWTPIDNTAGTMDKIEVRRATLATPAQQSETGEELLSDKDLDWTVVGGGLMPITQTSMIDSTAAFGTKYAYILKVTNKNNLMLDSLHVYPVKTP